ncbi:MAG: polyphosphate polymerase domain-containing protein [Clostridia bacterium]|nr:polyphosphate polymerase domain-containing protein [Clostridia bacterium]
MSGAYQSVFARVEKKFLLDAASAGFMADTLGEHGFEELCFGSPLVQSIYYDTQDALLVRRSVERPAYKEKLRLRAYGRPGPDSPAYIEIKKKAGGIVYKRRTGLPLAEAEAAVAAGSLPASAGQIGREIEWFIRRYGGLRPTAITICERRSFEKPSEGLRVTFDRGLRCRTRDFDLTRPAAGLPLLPPGTVLMEVKVPGAYPLWLADALWACGARQAHFSKYGTAWSLYIRPQCGHTMEREAFRSA